MSDQTVAIFNANWHIYQKVIAHNYMRHKDFGEQTAATFKTINASHPLKILDLGCGDAVKMAEQLPLQPVASYTGYDLSGPVLEVAKVNLAHAGCVVHLKEGLLQSFRRQEDSTFDVIYSSFAIHHLQDEQKKALLHDCFTRLAANGVMIVIDIFRSDEQERMEYINEYTQDIKDTWLALTTTEKEMVREHMEAYDFPASLEHMAAWAEEAGFTVGETLVVNKLNKMIVLRKGQ